jgi:hypothetical protein
LIDEIDRLIPTTPIWSEDVGQDDAGVISSAQLRKAK